MFFILSKVLQFLASPLVWIITLVLAGLFTKNKAVKKKAIIASAVMLVFFSNPFFLRLVMRWWEVPPVKASAIVIPYETGVLMGGAMRYYNSETERIVYGNSVDRLIQCVELYKKGKIKKILITGGSGLLWVQKYKEADLLKNVMLNMGIPEADIISENISKNTRENIIYTGKILKNNFKGKTILVITSGYHMRRTLACFKKEGINAVPYSVDQYSGRWQWTPDKTIIPNASIIQAWDILLHEWTGFLTYKLIGYL